MAFTEPAIEETLAEVIQLFGEGGPAAGTPAPRSPFIPYASGDPQHSIFWIGGSNPLVSVWHIIFGRAAQRPNPRPLTQAQINRYVALALGNATSLTTGLAGWLDDKVNALQYQVNVDVAAIYSDVNSVTQGLAGQIASLARMTGGNVTAAIDTAVARADAHTQALVSRVADSLGAQIAALNAEEHHLYNEMTQGDANTLGAAQRYTDSRVAGEAHAREAVMAGLAATERSDVLNLNQRITSVQTTLEGDVTAAARQAEGFATGLVDGLNVPGLRSDVTGLAGQVAKLATESDQCLTPLCDTVTPNASQLGRLGNFLKGFEGVGLIGLLAVLVAGAVEDPRAAATAVVDAGGWATDVGVELAQAVSG